MKRFLNYVSEALAMMARAELASMGYGTER